MIEKMKMVYVVSSVSKKQEMLDGLKDLGILHLAEKKSPAHAVSEKFANLSKTASTLLDYAPDKKEQKKSKDSAKPAILSDDEFETLYGKVREALECKSNLLQEISSAKAEIERIQVWGEFSPADIRAVKEAGYDLHFYRLSNSAYQAAVQDENLQVIRLAPIEKMDAIAVLGRLPETIQATEFTLPAKSITELNEDMEACNAKIAECDAILKDASRYQDSFQAQMLKVQNEEEDSAASETAGSDEDFVWISGYIPEVDMETFKAAARQHQWAWAEDEVSKEDDQIPTKMRYNKVSRLIQPIFDILGILPGYRETDISLWFLLFFVLFFAMIIGDAAYGVLILLATIGLIVKTKKMDTIPFLLLILSIATICWGAITGTWFGMEKAMDVPFLRALVIPEFSNYPELFGVSTAVQQNTIMKFSFSIGAIQMALGSLISIKKKIGEKNLSWVADLGWLCAVVAMYLLSLYLVIGEQIPVLPVFACIGVAFILVVLFGGMSPERTFGQGLKAGLADAFTVFLNTISCFGNVMSYIRLFAVGMAGFAISQSFNGMAAGFHGPLIILAVCIVVLGHALNIIMCFLSVVVHGVRLNVLEFSGQAGLEWTGIGYNPFKVIKKLKK